MLSAVHPVSAVMAYGAFSRNAAWDEHGDRAQSAAQAGPEVDPDILAGVEDQAPVRSLDENYYEFRAYNYLLVRAHNLPALSLGGKARRDLTFAHLFEEPHKYRGQIVHVEGTLRRLRRFDPVRSAQKEGVKDLYEGWVFAEPYFNNPFCIIASEIGPGVTVGEQLHQRVSFDGYFFKRFRYKAGDSVRDAPILIGRSIEVAAAQSAEEEPAWSFSRLALPAFLTLFAVTAGVCVGLTWWFRRGDDRVRRRLAAAREATFTPPSGLL
jgi:hypothetical protein